MFPAIGALVLPERALRSDAAYRVPLFALVFVIFTLHLTGTELVARFYASPQVVALVEHERRAVSEQPSFGPPAHVRESMASSRRFSVPASSAMAVVGAIAVVVQSLAFVGVAFLCRSLLGIFTQFLGGEEVPYEDRPHGRSRHLVLYAWVPLAVRRLAEGILTGLQDPAGALTATSLAAYREQTRVSFSVLALLRFPVPKGFFGYVASSLTDPFFLWSLLILTMGGSVVYRLRVRSAAAQSSLVVVALGLISSLLATMGLTIGV